MQGSDKPLDDGDSDVGDDQANPVRAHSEPDSSLPNLSSQLGTGVTRPAGQKTREFAEIQTSSRMVGPYKILQKIGEGGMGMVFMAEQEKPIRRRVALKLIRHEHGSSQVLARFEAERQALAMMDHHNIAKVLDADTADDGSPYFVMELVKGIPFTEYCDKNKLSIRERLELFVPVCRAVQHAHQKGIIHRDLKPSNVLVALYDGQPVPKVIDFGLAKALEHRTRLTDKTMFTEYGAVVGTLQYMSPEQAEMNQLDVDTRTDIYSLGVMLYELLTGSTPLDRDTMGQHALLEVLRIIREKEPPTPSTRLSETGDQLAGVSDQRKIDPKRLQQVLRGELDWIAMKSLEKDRTRRYATAEEFACDVRRFLNHEAVLARPQSATYRLRKLIGKNRGFFLSATLLAVALIGGIMATSWFAISASRLAQSERQQRNVATQKSTEALIARELANQETIKAERMAENAISALAQSNFVLARSRWSDNAVLEAFELLYRVPPEHRNIEWYLTRNQFEGGVFTAYGHVAPISAVTFSPDGRLYASAARDGSIRVLDATTGKLQQVLNGHAAAIRQIAFTTDGKFLLSCGLDSKVCTWNLASNQHAELPGNLFDLSHDGSRLAIVTHSAIEFREPATGRLISSVVHDEQSTIEGLALDHDGSLVVTRDTSGWLRMLELDAADSAETLKPFLNIPFQPEELLRDPMLLIELGLALDFNAVGNQLVYRTGSSQFGFLNYDQKLGFKQAPGELSLGDSIVTAFAWSPDGALVAAGFVDGRLRVFERRSGRILRELTGHFGFVSHMAFSPDGARIVTGSSDGTSKVWNITTNTRFPQLSGHTDRINGVVLNRSGSRVVSASGHVQDMRDQDNSIRVWETSSGQEVLTTGTARPNLSIDANGYGNCTITGDTERVAEWIDGVRTREFESGKYAFSVSISSDESLIAAAAKPGIKVWDRVAGTLLAQMGRGIGTTRSIDFSPDTHRLLSGGEDGYVRLWNPLAGKLLKVLGRHPGSVSCVRFSPDGNTVASAGRKGWIHLWNLDNDTHQSFQAKGNWFSEIDFSPDGQRMLSIDLAGRLTIWNLETGKATYSETLTKSSLNAIDISRDGTQIALAVGSADDDYLATDANDILLLDAGKRSEFEVLTGHTSDIISFSKGTTDVQFISVSAHEQITWQIHADTTRDGRASIVSVAPKFEDIPSTTKLPGYADGNLANGEIEPDFDTSGMDDPLGIDLAIQNIDLYFAREAGLLEPLMEFESQRKISLAQVQIDDRLMALGRGSHIILVDRSWVESAEETAKRLLASRPNPTWHLQQARSAEDRSDWFAAIFHYAWAIRYGEKRPSGQALAACISKFASDFPSIDLTSRLPQELRQIMLGH